ncbi:hypothetical protein NDU88_010118 [Pleurodeles waltl]|uniref:Uncharacterized protein n=1 Tax=Pleurodeles waltl TaxID=8319 RepID=A0AAV7S0Y3_PLEWA|nr:hypothetical protein NDU88_010118 [Pleurodeles waltl]
MTSVILGLSEWHPRSTAKGRLPSEIPAKRMAQSGPQEPEGGDGTGPAPSEGNRAPLTRAFMEQLFRSLREDFAMLKRDIVADIKNLKLEVIEPSQRVDTVEQTQDAREEELDCHRRELLTLQDKNQNLQYQIEDVENRSRGSNIRIKGIPAQAVAGSLEDFVVHLFRHMAPSLKEQDNVLDRMHRAGRPARTPGQALDILTCLHYYKQKEVIIAAIQDMTTIEFEGHRVGLYQDFSTLTQLSRRLLRPVTEILREEGIKYQWGHPFRLLFTWHSKLRSIRTLEEAQRLEGMPQNLEERAQMAAPPARQQSPGQDRLKPNNRRRTTHKPSMVARQMEKPALIRSLRSQDSVPEVDSDH